MAEMAKPAVTSSVAPEALAAPAEAKVGDTVLYARSLTALPGQSLPLAPDLRVAFVTKVHVGRGGTVNLVYFQSEKGEDPVMFAEDVPYHVDSAWPGHWSKLPA
jgi:hypothetical protein